MKIINNKNFLSLCAIAMMLIVSSCGNKDVVTPATPTGTFMFHLHTDIASNEVDAYGTTYMTTSGRNMSLNLAQFYISGVQLVKLDGSTVDVPGNVLKVFEKEEYLVGNAPIGNYASVKFKVGLNAATNLLNATNNDTLLNRKEMWFGTSPQPEGYVFLNFQGTIDTSVAMNKTPVPFIYKIGTNANYSQVSMGIKNFTVVEKQVVFSHIYIDYSQLFNGINLTQAGNLSVTTAAANTSTVASQIVKNISAMFTYE